MEQIRLGIIGTGSIGRAYAEKIQKGLAPRVKLAAVTASGADKREWAQTRLPGVPVYLSGKDLIESGAADSVLVAVPHYLHPELSILALRRGLHVLCEKPAGVYTRQVREMNEEAARSAKTFAIMFNQRVNGVYRKLHSLVHSGEMGALKRVNWIVTDWYRPQAYYDSRGWRATWAQDGGGVLLNQSPHQLDLLQWICGLPVKVRAFCHFGKWHDIEVEDDVTAYMEFANGATGVFVTSTADAPGTNRLELTLEGGKIVCEDDQLTLWRLAVNEREFCKSAEEGFEHPPYTVERPEIDVVQEQHLAVINAFAEHILTGAPLVAEGAEGIRELMLSNAMYLSAWLGRDVTLPIDEKLFLQELNRRRAVSKQREKS